MLDKRSENLTFNVGSGKSYSILQLIDTFEKVNNLKVNYEFSSRRVGDIAISYADTTKISNLLKWKPLKNLEDMCKDGWRWQRKLVEMKNK